MIAGEQQLVKLMDKILLYQRSFIKTEGRSIDVSRNMNIRDIEVFRTL